MCGAAASSPPCLALPCFQLRRPLGASYLPPTAGGDSTALLVAQQPAHAAAAAPHAARLRRSQHTPVSQCSSPHAPRSPAGSAARPLSRLAVLPPPTTPRWPPCPSCGERPRLRGSACAHDARARVWAADTAVCVRVGGFHRGRAVCLGHDCLPQPPRPLQARHVRGHRQRVRAHRAGDVPDRGARRRGARHGDAGHGGQAAGRRGGSDAVPGAPSPALTAQRSL
jgi:hypothetical protein